MPSSAAALCSASPHTSKTDSCSCVLCSHICLRLVVVAVHWVEGAVIVFVFKKQPFCFCCAQCSSSQVPELDAFMCFTSVWSQALRVDSEYVLKLNLKIKKSQRQRRPLLPHSCEPEGI